MTIENDFLAELAELEKDVEFNTYSFAFHITENITRLMNAETPVVKRADLARRMGVSPVRVTNILKGTGNLEIKTIVALAMALGTTPHDLCGKRTTPDMFQRPLTALIGGGTPAAVKPVRKKANDGNESEPNAA